MKKRILSVFLVACMALALLPASALAAGPESRANEDRKEVMLGADGLRDGDIIYYGYDTTNSGPAGVQWLVLDADAGNATGPNDSLSNSEGAVDNSDALFLIERAPDQLDPTGYETDDNGVYQGSAPQEDCLSFLETNTYEKERDTILSTTKSDGAVTYYEKESAVSHTFPAVENNLNSDKLFLPSIQEVSDYIEQMPLNPNETYETDDNGLDIFSRGTWLTRSKEEDSNYVAQFDRAGNFTTSIGNRPGVTLLRPAMNLNRNDILMVTSREGGAVETYDPEYLHYWKLTLLDDDHTLESVTVDGSLEERSTITVNYTGASVGHQLDVLFIQDGEPTYYDTVVDEIQSPNGSA